MTEVYTLDDEISSIIPHEEPAPSRAPVPLQLIERAIQSNASMEVVERLFALQERHEANEARRQYVQALAQFKALGLRVHKDKTVNQGSGRPSYKHATLSNIIETVSPALADCGLSATWQTAQDANTITVTCILRHSAGHAESVSLSGQPDQGPGRNALQAVGSTITYLQRYTLMAITGVAASDQDDDGRGGDRGAQYITDEQADEVTALLHATGSDFEGFLKWAGVETVHEIGRKDFRRVMAALEAKAKKQREDAANATA